MGLTFRVNFSKTKVLQGEGRKGQVFILHFTNKEVKVKDVNEKEMLKGMS